MLTFYILQRKKLIKVLVFHDSTPFKVYTVFINLSFSYELYWKSTFLILVKKC